MKRFVAPCGAGDRWVDRWFAILVSVSVALLSITFFAYALRDTAPPLPRVLHWFGLGGENSVGAWWSAILLLLAAILAFDGFRAAQKSVHERRGWLTLAVILLMLSFDEGASLHEYLDGVERSLLVIPGLLGVVLTVYMFRQFFKAGVARSTILSLAIAFALLATIPVQETIQHSVEWESAVAYGIRAFAEEGTELAAMLIFVAVTANNTRTLLNGSRRGALELSTGCREPLIVAAAVAVPVLAAATFVMPYPGGPADWLAASLYGLCAVSVVRNFLLGDRTFTWGVLLLGLYFVGASMLSSALKLMWTPDVMGITIGLRGAGVCVLLLTGAFLLRANGRPVLTWALGLGAAVAAVAALRPQAQFFWCAFPSACALYIYAVESKVAAPRAFRRPGVRTSGLALTQRKA